MKKQNAATTHERVEEAARRLRYLINAEGLAPEFLDEFRNGNIMKSESVQISDGERTMAFGCISPIDQRETRMVMEFEREHNATVYTVIATVNGEHTWYDLLYVSQDKDEWELDHAALVLNCSMVFCHADWVGVDDFCPIDFTIGEGAIIHVA
jgi:hypothetical protein